MRKPISMLVAAALILSLTACARPMTICGVTYDSYGLLNADDKKNPDIEYKVIWGNVVWAVLLFEMIVPPIYFLGFSIFEPVGKKPLIKGEIMGKPAPC